MNKYLVILHVEDREPTFWQGPASDEHVAQRKALRWLRRLSGPDCKSRDIYFDLTFRLENEAAQIVMEG